jgi:hypothetical protein
MPRTKSDVSEFAAAPSLSRTVAGEDLRVDDFIALFVQTWEFPSFFWNSCDHTLPPDELVRLTGIPDRAGQPLKVAGVCLPFVYALDPVRRMNTIDLRRTQVVRLDSTLAKSIWRSLRTRTAHPFGA